MWSLVVRMDPRPYVTVINPDSVELLAKGQITMSHVYFGDVCFGRRDIAQMLEAICKAGKISLIAIEAQFAVPWMPHNA